MISGQTLMGGGSHRQVQGAGMAQSAPGGQLGAASQILTGGGTGSTQAIIG
jgi:hypothetical protein